MGHQWLFMVEGWGKGGSYLDPSPICNTVFWQVNIMVLNWVIYMVGGNL